MQQAQAAQREHRRHVRAEKCAAAAEARAEGDNAATEGGKNVSAPDDTMDGRDTKRGKRDKEEKDTEKEKQLI